MEVELRVRAPGVGAVKPDDVVVLVLDPDAAEEPSFAGFRQRRHVEDQAAHLAQEFTAHVVKVLVLAVKVVHIEVYHLFFFEWYGDHREGKETPEAAEQLVDLP